MITPNSASCPTWASAASFHTLVEFTSTHAEGSLWVSYYSTSTTSNLLTKSTPSPSWSSILPLGIMNTKLSSPTSIPLLTSLTLHNPFYNFLLLLRFFLQFPKLENLCIAWPRNDGPGFYVPYPPSVDQYPPSCGSLRLVGCNPTDYWPLYFHREDKNWMNFRMVELESFHGTHAQNVLEPCAHTLEDVSFASYSVGKYAWILVFFISTGRIVNETFVSQGTSCSISTSRRSRVFAG
jgi:hypothetical protein